MSRGEDTHPNTDQETRAGQQGDTFSSGNFSEKSLSTAEILNLPPGDQPGWAGLQPLNGWVWWED